MPLLTTSFWSSGFYFRFTRVCFLAMSWVSSSSSTHDSAILDTSRGSPSHSSYFLLVGPSPNGLLLINATPFNMQTIRCIHITEMDYVWWASWMITILLEVHSLY